MTTLDTVALTAATAISTLMVIRFCVNSWRGGGVWPFRRCPTDLERTEELLKSLKKGQACLEGRIETLRQVDPQTPKLLLQIQQMVALSLRVTHMVNTVRLHAAMVERLQPREMHEVTFDVLEKEINEKMEILELHFGEPNTPKDLAK